MKQHGFMILCLVIILAICANINQSFTTIGVAANMLEKGTVVLDAGHGGEDGGAVGITGVLEKDLNLPITLLVRDLLQNNGYRVVMTREDDCDLGDPRLAALKDRKRSDIKKRVELVNTAGADLVLSLHQNHFEQNKYKGAQIFYYNENSKTLAELLQCTIVEQVQPENNRLAKKTDRVYLLKNAEIPAVIIECGFISNKEEAELLMDDAYQLQLAQAIYKATASYLEQMHKG